MTSELTPGITPYPLAERGNINLSCDLDALSIGESYRKARAQQAGKLPTIGFMGPRNVARGSPRSPHGGDLGQYRQPKLRPGNGRGSGGGPHAGLSTQLPRTALVSGR